MVVRSAGGAGPGAAARPRERLALLAPLPLPLARRRDVVEGVVSADRVFVDAAAGANGEAKVGEAAALATVSPAWLFGRHRGLPRLGESAVVGSGDVDVW